MPKPAVHRGRVGQLDRRALGAPALRLEEERHQLRHPRQLDRARDPGRGRGWPERLRHLPEQGGPLDGRGLFGPLRVYIEQWNFNSGLFHGLERGLIGLGMDPGAAGRVAKRMMGLAMLAVLLAVTWLAAAANVYFGLSPWLQNTLASRGARMLLGETP